MIILNRILMECSVIMGLDTNSNRQGPVVVSSELRNEPVNFQKIAEYVDRLTDSWSYSSWRQNIIVPVRNKIQPRKQRQIVILFPVQQKSVRPR